MAIVVPHSRGCINQDNNCDMNKCYTIIYIFIKLIGGYVAKVRVKLREVKHN